MFIGKRQENREPCSRSDVSLSKFGVITWLCSYAAAISSRAGSRPQLCIARSFSPAPAAGQNLEFIGAATCWPKIRRLTQKFP